MTLLPFRLGCCCCCGEASRRSRSARRKLDRRSSISLEVDVVADVDEMLFERWPLPFRWLLLLLLPLFAPLWSRGLICGEETSSIISMYFKCHNTGNTYIFRGSLFLGVSLFFAFVALSLSFSFPFQVSMSLKFTFALLFFDGGRRHLRLLALLELFLAGVVNCIGSGC